MKLTTLVIACVLTGFSMGALAACPYDQNCLSNAYGWGNPYRADGLMNPFNGYDSSSAGANSLSQSATDAFSTRKFGNPYSPDSPSNPYGAGNPYDSNKVYGWPSGKTTR